MVRPPKATLVALALCAVLAAPRPGHAAELTSVEVRSEGRLVRVSLSLEGEAGEFSLSRQGPPDERDLVLAFPGSTAARNALPAPADGEEPLLEIRLVPGAPGEGLKLILPRLGDSLVRMDHARDGISLLMIPPEKGDVTVAGAYRVGRDDVLAVNVFGHEDLTKTTKVGPDGLINFPLIGNVHASGRTVDAISKEIQERLAESYLVDPHVTVSVWEYLSQWVNVMGEVTKPGRYYLTGPTTLVDAVSMAGGLKPSAGDTILVTRRPGESDPTEAGQVMRFSSTSMMGQESGAAGFLLRPGDVVNVTVGEFVYLEGEVRSPGAYPLERETTLMGALGMAGGLARGVDDAILELIRDRDGRMERTSYSTRELREGSDPVLMPGDTVVVRRRS